MRRTPLRCHCCYQTVALQRRRMSLLPALLCRQWEKTLSAVLAR